MTNTIGIIGLGNAGASLCQALIGKGVTVLGLDLDPARQDTARALGVTVFDSPAAVDEELDKTVNALDN